MLAILLLGLLVADPGNSTATVFQAGRFSLTAPLVDQDPESGLWAVGANWKLNVRSDGAAFYPRSRDMERHRPLEIGVPLVTFGGEPMRTDLGVERIEGGDLVVDRGTYRERWNLALNSVEQTFEFDAAPTRAELVIDLPIATQWRYRGRDAGLLFSVDGMGDVRYGDVTTRDAAGRSVSTSSEFLGDRIRLHVPESFLENAAFPLVVDPVIEFLVLEAGSGIDVVDPSSTYDAASDRFLVVFSTRPEFGKGDADLLGIYLDGDGNSISSVALDLTTNDALTPAACHLAFTSYFPVAYKNISVLGVNSIRVRFLTTSTSSVGPAFTVKSGDYCNTPKIAGSTRFGVSKTFVVYAEGNLLNQQNKLKYVTISNLGVFGASNTIDSGGSFRGHDVTVTDGPSERWVVVWADATNPTSVILNGRLFDSQTAQPIGNELFFGSNGGPIIEPVVAGDGQTFVCMWERHLNTAGDSVIFARKLKFQSGSLATDGPMIDFSALDDVSGSAIDSSPRLARDGGRYVYAGNVGVTNVTLGTFLTTPAGIQLLEQDQLAPSYGSNMYQGDLTSKFDSGGEVGAALVSWCPRNGSEVGLEAALYSPLLGSGGVQVSPTGCGGIGLEPQISFNGQLSLAGGAATIELAAQPISSPQIWIGTPLSWQLCTSCPFGVAPTNVILGSTATLVNGSNPSLVGTSIAIQGVVNEPLLGTACVNFSGTRFQTSDTLIVTLQ